MEHIYNGLNLTLLADAVEASNTSFIITDHTAEDDPIIYCNNAFERLTGYQREDILGKNCRFLQGQDRKQSALALLASSISTGSGCTIQLTNYRKDGTAFINELTISPVSGHDGKITHLIGIQRDITEQVYTMPQIFNHEWRTPLTIVKSTLQILQRKGLSVNDSFLAKSLSAALNAIGKLEIIGKTSESSEKANELKDDRFIRTHRNH